MSLLYTKEILVNQTAQINTTLNEIIRMYNLYSGNKYKRMMKLIYKQMAKPFAEYDIGNRAIITGFIHDKLVTHENGVLALTEQGQAMYQLICSPKKKVTLTTTVVVEELACEVN